MCDDLLPESVMLFLDDFETSLSLPILVVIILCTAQFVGNNIFGVGHVIYRNLKKPAIEARKKMAGILGKPATAVAPIKNPKTDLPQEDEEWDYCDDENC